MKTWKEIKQETSDKIWFAKEKAKRKAEAVVQWCSENKELAIAMIPVGLMALRGAGKLVNSVDRKIDMKKEQELQELYIYDHSLGMYHKLRRPLKSSEKIEIDRRRAAGESKIQILSSMGLLD